MQGTPRWWQNGRRVQAVLAENQTADVRLNIGPENDFWFTDDGNIPVAVLRVIGPVCPLDPLKFTSSITDVLPEDVHSYKKALQEHQMINRPVSFYLALADAWLLVNEQQPVYQFRIRNQYNGMTTEWNSVARDKVIEVIKMQPETAEFRVLVPSAPEPAANARQLISEIEGLREAIGKLYPANTDVRRIARNSGWMHVYDDTNAKMNFADNARNTPYLDAFVTQLHLFLTDDRE